MTAPASRAVPPVAPPAAPTTARRWLRPVLGAVVALGFAYLTVRRLDWVAMRGAWRAASPWALALALAFLAVDFTARAARWWWMLRALEPGLPFRACLRPFFVSLAVNNTVPLRAGDVMRAFGFRDELRSPPARVLGTLVIERALDAFVLLAVFFAGLTGVAAGALPAAFVRTGAILGAAVLAVILALLVVPRPMRRLAGWVLSRGPLSKARWARTLDDVAGQLFETLALVQAPMRAVQLLGLSLLAWACEGGMYAAVAWALHTPVAPAGPWFALATGTLATLLPSSPGYVGTFDFFAITGLVAYGAPRSAAAANALLVHLLLWLPVTLAGAFLAAVTPAARLAARRALARTPAPVSASDAG